uniref:Uncharacterized protein n=1 Tax=Glossina palpalis gambiensis TaxID=67801 RepID=A0A1B0AQ62_9MUSC
MYANIRQQHPHKVAQTTTGTKVMNNKTKTPLIIEQPTKMQTADVNIKQEKCHHNITVISKHQEYLSHGYISDRIY